MANGLFKKGFLPSQKYVYVTNNDMNLVTQYCYKMNKHTSQWELQKKAVVSKNRRYIRPKKLKRSVKRLLYIDAFFFFFLESELPLKAAHFYLFDGFNSLYSR